MKTVYQMKGNMNKTRLTKEVRYIPSGYYLQAVVCLPDFSQRQSFRLSLALFSFARMNALTAISPMAPTGSAASWFLYAS